MTRILVIVVTYNGMRWIERCLNSLLQSSLVPDVFILDNDSKDGTADYIEEHYPQMHLARCNYNSGFAGGNNIGFQYALEKGYDYVYLMNQDAWVLPDTLRTLVEIQQRHPEFAVLSPMQKQADGEHFNRAFGRDVVPAAIPVKGEPALSEVQYVMAAHWLMSRQCLERIGLFASLFPIFGNDDNYCQRIHFHGMKMGIVTSVDAIHDHIYRSDRPIDQVVYQNYYMASLVRLCNINRPIIVPLLLLLPYTVVKTARYHSWLPWRRLIDVLGHMKTVLRTRRITRLDIPQAV